MSRFRGPYESNPPEIIAIFPNIIVPETASPGVLIINTHPRRNVSTSSLKMFLYKVLNSVKLTIISLFKVRKRINPHALNEGFYGIFIISITKVNKGLIILYGIVTILLKELIKSILIFSIQDVLQLQQGPIFTKGIQNLMDFL